MISIVESIEDNLMLIVNPIDDKAKGLTSLPKYGILGRLKLKMNVPNGKTRIVIEGLDRVELLNYEEVDNYYNDFLEEAMIADIEKIANSININRPFNVFSPRCQTGLLLEKFKSYGECTAYRG